jgi:hypothetical protein
MGSARFNVLFPLPGRFKEPILYGSKLQNRCVFDLIDLNAVGILAQLEESVLDMGVNTFTMRLLILAS